jgi:hypothetical protein
MEFRIAIWAAAASRCWCVGCLFLGDKQGHYDTADCVHPGPVNVRSRKSHECGAPHRCVGRRRARFLECTGSDHLRHWGRIERRQGPGDGQEGQSLRTLTKI